MKTTWKDTEMERDDVVRLWGEKQFIKEEKKIKTIGQRLNEIKE